MKRLLLTVALVLSANLAGAQPAAVDSRPAAAATPHVVPLQGTSNFRDVGGYLTEDGRRVRRGVVYRSSGTDTLTVADARLIKRLGIRVFCDLRDAPERHPRLPGVNLPRIVIWPDEPRQPMQLGSAAAADRMIREGYAQMPEAYAPQIGDIFRMIARGDVPLAFNCSAGKDRTGFTAAVLLRTLGVPRETVMADFLASNRLYRPTAADLRSGPAAWAATGADPATVAVLMGVNGAWLDAAFAAIDQRYGSLNGYLRDGLRLTPQELAMIRRRMLEPAGRHGR
jgi:protein-tyrosine phosphatase